MEIYVCITSIRLFAMPYRLMPAAEALLSLLCLWLGMSLILRGLDPTVSNGYTKLLIFILPVCLLNCLPLYDILYIDGSTNKAGPDKQSEDLVCGRHGRRKALQDDR